VIKIWANLIRFVQNQNLAPPKTLDLLWLCSQDIIPHVLYSNISDCMPILILINNIKRSRVHYDIYKRDTKICWRFL